MFTMIVKAKDQPQTVCELREYLATHENPPKGVMCDPRIVPKAESLLASLDVHPAQDVTVNVDAQGLDLLTYPVGKAQRSDRSQVGKCYKCKAPNGFNGDGLALCIGCDYEGSDRSNG